MMAVPVQVTCIRSGRQHLFSSMKQAAEKGGFVYPIVQACVLGRQASHAGHLFKAMGPTEKGRRKAVRREEQVGRLLTDGQSYDAIGKHLGIKVATVKFLASRARSMGIAPAVSPNGSPLP